ncbi:MAG: YvcK family protein [Bacilli bacterium]|nr:YvcK family protein [Bacilli bacterium]
MMNKVVVLGGGHGLSVLLKGLKLFPIDITAVVTVADNGASTGRLRDEFKIPAVGDLRNVIISLSESEPLLEELFQYRFKSTGNLDGHSLGNLLLAALLDMEGSLTSAVASLSKILNLKGKVLPLTEDVINLIAETKNNETLIGEVEIRKSGKELTKLYYDQEPKVLPEVITAILEADLIIFGLGSLYTSIIPHLICPEVVTAIKNSNAKKIYVCNALTEKGETDNFKDNDHVNTLNK